MTSEADVSTAARPGKCLIRPGGDRLLKRLRDPGFRVRVGRATQPSRSFDMTAEKVDA